MSRTGKDWDWSTCDAEVVLTRPEIPEELIKDIAEVVGVGTITDSAAQFLSDDLTYRVKQIVQDGVKFMEMGKRKTLNTQDIDMALKVRNIEPVYGCGFEESPERDMEWQACGVGAKSATGASSASGHEENVLDLEEILKLPLPPLHADVSLKAHWLAIDGVPPDKLNTSLKKKKKKKPPKEKKKCPPKSNSQ